MTKPDWIYLAIFLCLLGAHVGFDEPITQAVVKEAQEKAERKKAELYAGVIAGCLNGQVITIDGEPAAYCRSVK